MRTALVTAALIAAALTFLAAEGDRLHRRCKARTKPGPRRS